MEDEKEDEDNARRSGGGGTNLRTLAAGWFQKQKGNLQSKSGRDYGHNDAPPLTLPPSSFSMFLPTYNCHIPSNVIWSTTPQQAQTYSQLYRRNLLILSWS